MSSNSERGEELVSALGGKDWTGDGKVINLAIVGSSCYYDFSLIEEHLDKWVERIGFPDLVIVGGASGVDYLAERWADNNNVKIAVFHEAWQNPRLGLQDSGRGEAGNELTRKIISSATHIIAFPSATSKWTRITIQLAEREGMNVTIIELNEQEEEFEGETLRPTGA